MRDLFPDFYSRTDKEWETLWQKALFVLDANVVLAILAMPQVSQNELLVVLESLGERLWLPFQAALEYQRNRKKKMEDAVSAALKLQKDIVGNVENVRGKLRDLELEYRGMKEEKLKVQAALDDFAEQVKAMGEALRDGMSGQDTGDKVCARIDALFKGRIGPAPSSQQDLDELTKDADQRYSQKIGPGYSDAGKDQSDEPNFRHAGITYARKYGDLILWRQVLAHAKRAGISHLVMVTADQKEDWWRKDKAHQIVGPNPDLTHEARTSGGIADFHLYTLRQFLEYAKRYENAAVSDKTLQEARDQEYVDSDYVTSYITSASMPRPKLEGSTKAAGLFGLAHYKSVASVANKAAADLMSGLFQTFFTAGGISQWSDDERPDFLAEQDGGRYAFVLLHSQHISVSSMRAAVNRLVRWKSKDLCDVGVVFVLLPFAFDLPVWDLYRLEWRSHLAEIPEQMRPQIEALAGYLVGDKVMGTSDLVNHPAT